MPIQIFEGVRGEERDQLQRRNLERRFYALAAAVRDHESSVRRSGDGVARQDENLYRRLRQLCGEPVTAEHGTTS
jgi:hypothetical protein